MALRFKGESMKFELKHKLIVTSVLMGVVPLLVSGYSAFSIASNALIEKANHIMEQNHLVQKNNIEAYIENISLGLLH